jgi:beta-galactosidase
MKFAMNTFARLLLVLLAVSSSAAETIQRLSAGWEYYQGTLGSTWEVWRGDAASDNVTWSPVALPHCFNGRDSVDPDVRYYQGHGWYRTKLKVANPYPNGRTLLKFDGAGQKSEVFVYTTKVGAHVGGYDEWTVDITDEAAKATARPDFKGEVPVAVLCDNSRDAESIPSDLSDFNRYGGLYRHVSLIYVPAISVGRVGVAATVKGTKGEVAIDVRLSNPKSLADDVTCEVVVTDPAGKVAYRSENAAISASLGGITAKIALEAPALWSPKSPQLYRATVTLRSKHGEQVVAEPFGFRSIEWVEHGPFKLNGERLLLKGTHYHEDHTGVAAAVPDEVVRQTLVAIKDMGANFVRLGHYQQAPLVLQICDELGLLVWEEIPWCRGGIGGDRYKQQCRDMLKALIEQHGNHPSVIMWGLGNENDWPGDFEKQDKEGIRAFMKELNDLSHKLDPSRPTTIRRCDFCKDIVDVYSPSIWAGWYSGRYTEYAASAEKALKDTKHFFHAEWGGDSHARRFSEEPEKIIAKVAVGEGTAEKGKAYKKSGGKVRMSKDGDWSESYMINLFDWHLKEQEKMPWLTGSAQWIFKDFATPLRPENPVPRVNQKGVVERDGTPKESYYVFQSYWAEKPMVRLLGHEWPVRWGKPGEAKEIRVYSNCVEVELFADGKSLGVKKRDSQDFPAAGLRWNVVLKDGPNKLRAVAKCATGELVDEITVGYQSKPWGKPAKLTLTELSQKDGVVTIEARMADAEGVPCLDCSNIVRFGMVGDGQLLDNLGTSTGSRVVQMYNGRAQISAKVAGHKVVFSASSEGRRTQFLNVENKSVTEAAPKADGAKPKTEKPASKSKSKSKAKTEVAPASAASAVAGTPVSIKVVVDVATIDRERILKAAEKALTQAPVSITAFPSKLSEGGANDFYSNGDYWWPDSTKPNGLPYIRRDGQTNPENFSQHRLVVKTLRDSVSALAAAYKITGDDKYVAKAAELLRVFFLDTKLRMNPNLDFAQAVPGVSPGRGIGIIDALHLIEVPAAVKTLEGSPAFPAGMAKDLRGWFRELAEWMATSKNGKEEAAAKNNHAVAFYLQLSVYADFIGDQEKLAACRKQYKEVFVGKQMALDGGFPLELARTKPYGYSIFQLDNMVLLCQVLSTKEDNLWDFTLPDGRGIRKAVAFLYPFLADKSKWTLKPDVQAWEGWPARQPGLLFAGRQFGESAYLDLWKKLPSDPTDPEVQRNIGVTQPVLW